MSSIAFSTDLHPDPRLRRIVFGSAVGLFVLGLLVIAGMTVAVGIRAVTGAGWVLLAACELKRLVRHNARIRRIRIYADGSAEYTDAADGRHAASLAAGSIVLDRIAWLRLDGGDGTTSGELLTGNSRKNKEWRRLQMIWRHLGKPD